MECSIRVMEEIRPVAFVMEEIPWLFSSRLKRFPHYEYYRRNHPGVATAKPITDQPEDVNQIS